MSKRHWNKREKEIIDRVSKIIDEEVGKEQIRLNELIFPMDKGNVSVCLQNLAVEIKNKIKGELKRSNC